MCCTVTYFPISMTSSAEMETEDSFPYHKWQTGHIHVKNKHIMKILLPLIDSLYKLHHVLMEGIIASLFFLTWSSLMLENFLSMQFIRSSARYKILLASQKKHIFCLCRKQQAMTEYSTILMSNMFIII